MTKCATIRTAHTAESIGVTHQRPHRLTILLRITATAVAMIGAGHREANSEILYYNDFAGNELVGMTPEAGMGVSIKRSVLEHRIHESVLLDLTAGTEG